MARSKLYPYRIGAASISRQNKVRSFVGIETTLPASSQSATRTRQVHVIDTTHSGATDDDHSHGRPGQSVLTDRLDRIFVIARKTLIDVSACVLWSLGRCVRFLTPLRTRRQTISKHTTRREAPPLWPKAKEATSGYCERCIKDASG